MLMLAACYYNPDLAQARAKAEVAEAAEITAGQRPNPDIRFTLTQDKSKASPWGFDPGINLPIETAGKRERRIEQAQHLSTSAEYQIGVTAWQVRSRIVHALIGLLAARSSAALFRKQAAVLEAVLGVFSERTAKGQLPSVTASQTLVAYQQALLNEKEADKQRAESKAMLASAIGVSAQALEGVAVNNSALERTADPPSLETALKQHNGLLAALAEYEAAHSALQLELARQVPDLIIGPGYEWNKDGNVFTLGLSLTLPILNNNEGPIAEAVAKRKLAMNGLNALQADIIGKSEIAGTALKAAKTKLQTADRLLAAQHDKLTQLQIQLRPGEASKLPLLLAESEIQTAAIARNDAWVQVLNARAALEEALQQPLFGNGFDAHALRHRPRLESQ